MAQCRSCKKSVGCGCNLKNGVCGTCLNETPVKIPAPTGIRGKLKSTSPVINRAYWTK